MICRNYLWQWHGRSLLGINPRMKVARRVLSPGKGITFTSRKIVDSSAETSSSGGKHFALRCRCWTPKASSPAHCRRSASRCTSPSFAKTEIANNCEYQGKVRNISAKYCQVVHFAAKPPGEMHRISRIFDFIRTTLFRGGKFKLFTWFSQCFF